MLVFFNGELWQLNYKIEHIAEFLFCEFIKNLAQGIFI